MARQYGGSCCCSSKASSLMENAIGVFSVKQKCRSMYISGVCVCLPGVPPKSIHNLRDVNGAQAEVHHHQQGLDADGHHADGHHSEHLLSLQSSHVTCAHLLLSVHITTISRVLSFLKMCGVHVFGPLCVRIPTM